MSILKLSFSEMNSRPKARANRMTSLNVFLITIAVLAALDLVLASLRGDSLAIYSEAMLCDLILTGLGLYICSDLIARNGQKFLSCFLAYMLFLWSCFTIIKLVCLT